MSFLQKSTLELCEGYLCVKHVTTHSTEPGYHVLYWPVRPCSKREAEGYDFPIGKELKQLSTEAFELRDQTGPYGSDFGRVYRLKDGGQTKPIKQEQLPCPCPKSGGKETRWHYGEWQKLLKQGWVHLPWVEVP